MSCKHSKMERGTSDIGYAIVRAVFISEDNHQYSEVLLVVSIYKVKG